MDMISVDTHYQQIGEAFSALVQSARVDSEGNLQNKNVLMEGFYREFLNLLCGWKLVNANAEKQNAAGIDLIDRENHVVAQVSATCDHEKIQHSLSGFTPPTGGTWHFVFIPVMMEAPKPRKPFDLPERTAFDPKADILDTAALLKMVQHAGQEKQFALAQFVALEKVKLWEQINGLLCRTRDAHPSFVLMRPDEIDKRLLPGIKEVKWDAHGKTDADSDICPVWDIIRSSWQKPENHSIVIEGGGGIGKTVTLFSIADEKVQYCPAPAVYVPMHSLVQYEDLSDYCRKQSDTYGSRINELAEKPWDNGPQLLVLLDGFNEVPAARQREMLNMLNQWHLRHPGAQFIAVSRPVDMVNLALDLDRDFKAKPIAITLEPMTEADARAYLTERGITPPEGADIWKTLVYPLFLTLYVKTNGLMDRKPAGYALAPKPPRSGGALIWNYLQRELLREDREDWVLNCAVACEYILPHIAYKMVGENQFTLSIDEAANLAEEALQSIRPDALPKHLKEIFKGYKRKHFRSPDLTGQLETLLHTVIRNAGVLVPDSEGETCAFMHQHFRDALAGLYLVNQAEMMCDGDPLPEVWHRAANHDVMDYAAELMEEPEAARLWEANRRHKPTDTTATYAMLELQRRRSDGTDSTLNFSGMDLRGMSLARYMRDGRQGEKDMKLFRKPENSENSKLSEDTFRNLGHTGSINCVAVTGDGLCVSGSNDRTLMVWDLRTGECLRIMEGHTDWIRCVVITGDGLCVSGSGDNTLRVWEPHTGECLHVMKGHTNGVRCVTVTVDGLCISGSWDKTLRVWDPRTGECLRVMEGHTGWVYCVAATRDGLCVSGAEDRTLRVWDSYTGKCLRVMKGHTKPINCVAVTEKGLCISGSDDGTLRVWDLNTGECLHIMKGHADWVICVAVMNDALCVSGSSDDTLRVWDLHTGKYLRVMEGHISWVRCVAMMGNGMCVSGSDDYTLRVWDLHTGECFRVMEGDTHEVPCVVVTMDGLCVSSSRDKNLWVWDSRNGECLYVMKGHTSLINSVAIMSDGLCISGSRDGTLRVWNPHIGECLRIMEGHTRPINSVAVTKDDLCVSGSTDRTLRVWDPHTGECIRIMKGHTDSIICVAVTVDDLCVSGSIDGTLRVWDLYTGECLRVLEGHTDSVTSIIKTGDGLCISGSDDKTLRVWDLYTGKCIRVMEGHTGSVKCVALMRDGLCVSESSDGILYAWDIHTGECKDIWYPMEIEVSEMDFSKANLTPVLSKMLRQNHAQTPEAD